MLIYFHMAALIVASWIAHGTMLLALKRDGEKIDLLDPWGMFKDHRRFVKYAIRNNASLAPLYAYYATAGTFIFLFLYLVIGSLTQAPYER